MPNLEIGGGTLPTEGYLQLDQCEYPWTTFSQPAHARIHVPDNYFDKIKAVHVLEHIQRCHVPFAVAEWFRTLKPGGELYVAVPNMMVAFKAYIEEPDPMRRQRLIGDVIYGGEPRPEDRHKVPYDLETLVITVRAAGFRVQESGVADDHHTKFWNEYGIKGLSIFCRGTKPSTTPSPNS